MASSRSRKDIAHLEEWIDGTTIQKAGGDSGDDDTTTGFAWNLYDHVLKLFSALVPLAVQPSSGLPRKDTRSLKESLGNLFLWGDGFRDGRLESVLEESDDLKESVVALLITLGEILISKLVPTYQAVAVSPTRYEIAELAAELGILLEKARLVTETDHESDGTSGPETRGDSSPRERTRTISALKTSTTCLMDLLPSMENTLDYASQINVDDQTSIPVEFQVSGPARTYVLSVYDRFAKADSRLVERLGEANWQRHMALRKSHELQRVNLDIAAPSKPVFEVQETPKSLFIPVSMFHDSGLGSSIPTQTSYAATVASHSSFISSLAEIDSGGLRVPSMPKEVSSGIPFTCDICGNKLSRIKTRIDWKRHVFADLKPYICTFSGCKDELLTFPTRKLWEDHEFSQHRVDRTWSCSDCPQSFPAPEQWQVHLQQDHDIRFNNAQFQIASSVAEKKTSQPIESLRCPLCLCVPGKSRRNFAAHVGKHMEGIALAALPRGDVSDSESDYESVPSLETAWRAKDFYQNIKKTADAAIRAIANAKTTKDVVTKPDSKDGKKAAAETKAPAKTPNRSGTRAAPLSPERGDFGVELGFELGFDSTEEEEFTIKCICGYYDDYGDTIYCVSCHTWQHRKCYNYDTGREYFHRCVDCKPRHLSVRQATERQRRQRELKDAAANNETNLRPDIEEIPATPPDNRERRDRFASLKFDDPPPRKISIMEDEHIQANPELYGLRRKVCPRSKSYKKILKYEAANDKIKKYSPAKRHKKKLKDEEASDETKPRPRSKGHRAPLNAPVPQINHYNSDDDAEYKSPHDGQPSSKKPESHELNDHIDLKSYERRVSLHPRETLDNVSRMRHFPASDRFLAKDEARIKSSIAGGRRALVREAKGPKPQKTIVQHAGPMKNSFDLDEESEDFRVEYGGDDDDNEGSVKNIGKNKDQADEAVVNKKGTSIGDDLRKSKFKISKRPEPLIAEGQSSPKPIYHPGEIFVTTQTNSFADLEVASSLSAWLHDPQKLRDDTGIENKEEVFRNIEAHIEEPQLRVELKSFQISNDTTVSRCYLVTSVPLDEGVLVAEVNGLVGFQNDYCNDIANGWQVSGHPLPLVFFHRHLPIFIDSRQAGSVWQWVRHSCRPNTELQTFIDKASEYHFCLVSKRPLVAGEEVTIPWNFQFSSSQKQLTQYLHNLSENPTILPDEMGITRGELKQLDDKISQTLVEHEGCACDRGANCYLRTVIQGLRATLHANH